MFVVLAILRTGVVTGVVTGLADEVIGLIFDESASDTSEPQPKKEQRNKPA